MQNFTQTGQEIWRAGIQFSLAPKLSVTALGRFSRSLSILWVKYPRFYKQ